MGLICLEAVDFVFFYVLRQTCHLPAHRPPTPSFSPLPLTFCPPTRLHTHTNAHCPYGAAGAQKQPDPFPGQEVRVHAGCTEGPNAGIPCGPKPGQLAGTSYLASQQTVSPVSFTVSCRGLWTTVLRVLLVSKQLRLELNPCLCSRSSSVPTLDQQHNR